MILRKDVIVYLHNPSGSYFHVAVELKNIPGALYALLSILRDMNVNVLGSFSSVGASERTGVWSGFIEDPNHTASEIKKMIMSSVYVLDSTVVASKDGFLVDGLHFPLAWNTGDRALMGRAKYFARMLHKIREEFGSGGKKILYDEGYAWGKETWAEMCARLGRGFALSNLNDVLKFYQAQGWFRLGEVRRDEAGGSVTVGVSESFECMASDSSGPYSQFIRGHLAGAFTEILETDMACQETTCIASGDEVCEFVLKPVSLKAPRPSRDLSRVGTRTPVAPTVMRSRHA